MMDIQYKLQFAIKIILIKLGIKIYADNSYGIKDLGIQYRIIQDTIKDQIEQLEKDDLI